MRKYIDRIFAFLILAALALTLWASPGLMTQPAYAQGPSGTPAAAPPVAAAGARTLTALVGAGQDTEQVMRFFPQSLTVRVGDTVTWKENGQEIHTVSFIGDNAFKDTPASWFVQDSGSLPGRMVPSLIVPQTNATSPADVMFDPLVFFATRQPGANVEHYSGTGYASSGVMAKTNPAFVPPNTPVNDTFSLTFDKPGTYEYVCLVHLGAMRGTVTVVDTAATTTVPEQKDIDAQAQKEIQPMVGLVKAAEAQSANGKKEAGPTGTTSYYVRAGATDFTAGDLTAQSFAFYPQATTIKAGDTVVWASTYIHTITFKPSPPAPDLGIVKPQPNGPPMIILNPEVFGEVRPAATYDPKQYYNSGDIGLLGSNGYTWSLTFDTPGTYEYYCALHQDLGMKGTIIVQPK